MNSQFIKDHAVSFAITFVSTFLVTAGSVLVTVPTENWTQATTTSIIVGIVISAARTALKLAVESLQK